MIDRFKHTEYTMTCPEGYYKTKTWIGLGWAILCHRMWHLYKHHRFMD